MLDQLTNPHLTGWLVYSIPVQIKRAAAIAREVIFP
jgi:hypothetical protein